MPEPRTDLAALDLAADHGHDELAAVHAGVLGDALAFGKGEQLGHGQPVQVVQTGRRVGRWRHGGPRQGRRPSGLRAVRLRVTLPDPSSLRATAMMFPPVSKQWLKILTSEMQKSRPVQSVAMQNVATGSLTITCRRMSRRSKLFTRSRPAHSKRRSDLLATAGRSRERMRCTIEPRSAWPESERWDASGPSEASGNRHAGAPKLSYHEQQPDEGKHFSCQNLRKFFRPRRWKLRTLERRVRIHPSPAQAICPALWHRIRPEGRRQSPR